MKLAFEAAFNLLCGELLGEGSYRKVWSCKVDPTLVVKVEKSEDWPSMSNVHENRIWEDLRDFKPAARWLAPIVSISPCGMVMLQKRAMPLRPNELPEKLPRFLTDLKPENYGLLDGRVVACDYAHIITRISVSMRKIDWRL